MGYATMFIYLALIVLVFYFLLIRPEKKRKAKLADMRSSLSVGDEITTIGGMVGKIVSIDEEFVTFETSEDRVRIEIARWAVSSVGRDTTGKR